MTISASSGVQYRCFAAIRGFLEAHDGNWFTAKEIALFADNAPPSWGRTYLNEMVRNGEVEKTMIGRMAYYRLKKEPK